MEQLLVAANHRRLGRQNDPTGRLEPAELN